VPAVANSPRLGELVAADVECELLATGFDFTEGPVWSGQEQCLYFTDILGDTIYRYEGEAGARRWRRPSNMANGLTLDGAGGLIACEHATSKVTRTDRDGAVTTLASHFEGRELNSPNDVVVKSDGSMYFTDPLYGRRAEHGVERPPELGFCGVYRLAPGGELTLLADDFPAPNGLCFSPGESLLYVNDTHLLHTRVFDVVPDGTLANGRLFFDEAAHGARWEEGDPDGIKVDERGNVFCTGPGGVWVISPEGEWLGLIEVPEIVANLTWGGSDWSVLYICATRSLYRVETRTRGHRVPHMTAA
jgi:gluconolactonase